MDIRPILSERSIVNWSVTQQKKRQDRWQKIAFSASCQSHRDTIPKIYPVQSFSDFCSDTDFEDYDLLLAPWEESTLSSALSSDQFLTPYKKIGVFIGPEGGITELEIELLKTKGFKDISLGNTVLRVEIAAVVLMSQLLCLNKK